MKRKLLAVLAACLLLGASSVYAENTSKSGEQTAASQTDNSFADQLFEKESSQELYFVSLGCFQKSTLYLLPVYNEFLNQLILKIYQTFDEYVSISQKNRYLPYHFVPHVSISRKLNEQQTNQAFKILNHYFEPFYGKVIQVALVKTNPYQEIKIWNL